MSGANAMGDSTPENEDAPAAGTARGTMANAEQQADSAKLAVKRKQLPLHITSPEKRAALEAIRDAIPGNSGVSQERRMLEALSRWPLTTYEGSRHLDCFDPRARAMALRDKGFAILTSWVRTPTECGRLHRIGLYTMSRSKAC